MIEKTIEAKFIAAIRAACSEHTANVVGYWQSRIDNGLKKDEPPFIRVTVAPRGGEAQSSKIYTCNMNIEVVAKVDTDPDKVKMVYWCNAVIDLLAGLNGDYGTLTSDDYSEDGVYQINGFQMEPGQPGYDSESECWHCDMPAVIYFSKA